MVKKVVLLSLLTVLLAAVYCFASGTGALNPVHQSQHSLIQDGNSPLGVVSDGGPLPLCPPRCRTADGGCTCNCCRIKGQKVTVDHTTVAGRPNEVLMLLADGSDPTPWCKLRTCIPGK